MDFRDPCPLCNLEKKTNWHFANDKFVVCDCQTCGCPMYVWRKHKLPDNHDIVEMIQHAKKNFPGRTLDFNRKSVKNHYHFHIR